MWWRGHAKCYVMETRNIMSKPSGNQEDGFVLSNTQQWITDLEHLIFLLSVIFGYCYV
jgi:hypothetical protein